MKIEYNREWFYLNAHMIDWWFDADTFDWYWSELLAYIDIWYDSSKFDKSYDELLLDSIK
tara:strand:- start:1149 stop:1328 length:180 start_codon:yes stop_codon:yes gene_type:complete